MPRLNLTVEGQTEQSFAVQLLIPHLGRHGVALAKPRLTAIARKKGYVHRGGLARYLPFRNDVVRWLKQDRGSDVYPRAKRTAGPIIAAHIGLESIRAKCRHFNDWLTKLEGLGTR